MVRSNGSHILKRLEEFAQNNRYIGEVRGRGYMIALEMVDDPVTRKPGTKRAARIKEYMFRHGVLMHTCGHYANVLRFMAPLTIEPDLADRGIDILGDALKEIS
jgi:4-aminobutyrate aminotransferase-like enzyme